MSLLRIHTPDDYAAAAKVLRAARVKISIPAAWCRDWFAKDAAGRNVPVSDPSACAWCVRGAVLAVTPGHGWSDARAAADDLLDHVSNAPPGRTVAIVSDNPRTTHADVMAIFDRAIARAETLAGFGGLAS